jgi:hypothetical protein
VLWQRVPCLEENGYVWSWSFVKKGMPVDTSWEIRYGGRHEAAVLAKAVFSVVVELVTSIETGVGRVLVDVPVGELSLPS